MIKTKAFFILLLSVTANVFLHAQSEDKIPVDSADVYTPSLEGAARHYKNMSRRTPRYSMEMGTHMSWAGGGNNAWGMYFRPEATFPIGDKWDVTVGVDVHQNYYNGAAFIPWGAVENQNGKYRGNSTDAILYVAASYYASHRLTLYGSGFVNMTGDGIYPFSPSKGISLGADYRIGRRAWIGVNFSYIESDFPLLYPYGMPMDWWFPMSAFY